MNGQLALGGRRVKPRGIRGPCGRYRARFHDGERLDELRQQHRYGAMPETLLFDDYRPTSQAGPSSRCTKRGEDGTVRQHIPYREHDAEVYVLGSLHGVVETVICGTHDDPPE